MEKDQIGTMLPDQSRKTLAKAGLLGLIFGIVFLLLALLLLRYVCFDAIDVFGFRLSLLVMCILAVIFAIVTIVTTASIRRMSKRLQSTNDPDAYTLAMRKLSTYITTSIVYMIANMVCVVWFLISLFIVEI
ncbi:MAG: hypothetical protein IKX51_04085 [Bacteroidales bacterium]|nr:hypothetical protein [Bacteroidales bacterium]